MIKVDHFLRTNLLEELLRTQFRYDRKDQQCKKEKSLILAEGSDQVIWRILIIQRYKLLKVQVCLHLVPFK